MQLTVDTGWLILTLAVVASGLLGWFVRVLYTRNQKLQDNEWEGTKKMYEERFKKMDERLDDGAKRMTSIEENYKDRFEKTNAAIAATREGLTINLHSTRETILTAISDLKTTMLENFVTKTECLREHNRT
jgi:hypothetical protein